MKTLTVFCFSFSLFLSLADPKAFSDWIVQLFPLSNLAVRASSILAVIYFFFFLKENEGKHKFNKYAAIKVKFLVSFLYKQLEHNGEDLRS